MSQYRTIIGMEVHAELKTVSKMFCGCKNDPFRALAPNTYTCPVCLGLPGALPVANKKAIEWTIKLGLALGCKINLFSKFDRKHYFYPDLPKGYQISQYDLPFCYDGVLETSQGTVRIRRVHLEEDTGKLIHGEFENKQATMIDFNRSGVPLVEIVTEPDITSAEQAKEYAKRLRQILRYLDISDCDMEQGGMRLEANISLQKQDQSELPNYKVELKNINSFRFLERGIGYEIGRQQEILEKGETPVQETRGYNPDKDQTFTQRVKESAEDYRYFPDPDIPPFRFTEEYVESSRQSLPELPQELIARWHRDYQIEPRIGEVLVEEPERAREYDKAIGQELPSGLSAEKYAKFIANQPSAWVVSVTGAKDTVAAFIASMAVDDVGDDEIISAILAVLAEQSGVVAQYRAGKVQVLHFLIGCVIKQLKKKIEVGRIQTLLEANLRQP